MTSDSTETIPLPETQRARRGHDFYPPASLAVPALYATEDVSTAEKLIQAHYFLGGCDWWITEYDPAEGLAFGYACLNDPDMAEWGYISLTELETVKVGPFSFPVERDLHWTPVRAADAKLPGWRASL